MQIALNSKQYLQNIRTILFKNINATAFITATTRMSNAEWTLFTLTRLVCISCEEKAITFILFCTKLSLNIQKQVTKNYVPIMITVLVLAGFLALDLVLPI